MELVKHALAWILAGLIVVAITLGAVAGATLLVVLGMFLYLVRVIALPFLVAAHQIDKRFR